MKKAFVAVGFAGFAAVAGVKTASVMDVSGSDVDMFASRVMQVAMEVASPDKDEKSSAKSKQADEKTGPEVVEKDILPELLVDLAAERKALEARAFDIDKEKAELMLAKDALTEQHRRLSKLKDQIDGLLASAEENHENDIAQLVKMYVAMKPPQAATIMNDLDIAVSVLVMAEMPERNSGPILAEMNPIRARAISKIIFERSRLPGNQDLFGVQLR